MTTLTTKKACESSTFLSGLSFARTGVFARPLDALGSNDRERVAGLGADLSSGLHSLAAMVAVTSDYLHIRAHAPAEQVYASDEDVADALFSISDLMRVLAAAMDAKEAARMEDGHDVQ